MPHLLEVTILLILATFMPSVTATTTPSAPEMTNVTMLAESLEQLKMEVTQLRTDMTEVKSKQESKCYKLCHLSAKYYVAYFFRYFVSI